MSALNHQVCRTFKTVKKQLERVSHKQLYSQFSLLLILIFIQQALPAQKPVKPVPPLYYGNGKLQYSTEVNGDRIPDFSYCGYMASEEPIPAVPVKIIVPPIKGDATRRIQSALDYVAALPDNGTGIRGAVLLQRGNYEVNGQLRINASGVVLRGSGVNVTTITGTGTGRLALIKIIGKNLIPRDLIGLRIIDPYVPVNAMTFHLDGTLDFKEHAGHIIIRRASTDKWIRTLGTDHFGGGITALGWKPGDQELFIDRRIKKIDGNTITIDAPITTAIDSTYGGASIYFYNPTGRVKNCGVENLSLVSVYDKNNPKDEDHRWNAINVENAEDCWIRQLNFRHFAGSAVSVLETSKRITVEDCISQSPISEIGGQRRYTFFTAGQQTLFQRCYAENGYHDFGTGYCAPGPNAFVQCESIQPYSFSGAIDSWASGVLFDVVNVDGNALKFGNRGQDNNGTGWAAANSVFWNCSAARIDCYKPPTAQNWAFGSWSQFAGDGYWNESNNSINPRSLFYAQLSERVQKNVSAQAQLMPLSTEASSSPSVETALELTKEASKPRLQLKDWIEQAGVRNKIPTDAAGAKLMEPTAVPVQKVVVKSPVMIIKNGLLQRGDELVTGKRQGVQWWSGGVQGKDLQQAKAHLTRFVPGRAGKGLTDNIDEVVREMLSTHTVAMEHNYGLWYDRRRDDHQRVRRMDGEVWPPFYEQPFARSGKETAWDGLSKYDLTKYNLFYWSRLKQFADMADQQGLVLVHQNYFQHNIIEAGAHYADFPWRTANNINNTGFNEPVNYAGDKRIFYAEQFYDISNPVRRELHRKYIRQCLNNFKDNNSVIQLIGEEFTGPVHFVKFWLDVIRDWEKETGKKPLIGLSVTRDVQDSILKMPAYSAIIDIIDIRYWHYQADGSVYAPPGGVSLAPRQHARLLKPRKTSFEQVYRAVKEYRDKYPGKAVIYSGDSYPEFGIAAFMAGGSLAVLPAATDQEILKAAAGMKPVKATSETEYILSDGKKSIIYNTVTRRLELR